jgi:hypothetical protein
MVHCSKDFPTAVLYKTAVGKLARTPPEWYLSVVSLDQVYSTAITQGPP